MSLGPGIHNISELLYHADPCEVPSLSRGTILALCTKTPEHAMRSHPRLNPGFEFRGTTKGMDIGTCTHGILLEGDGKAGVVDAANWQSKAAKEERARVQKRGLIPLLTHEWEQVSGMAKAARKFVDASPFRGIFERGKPEQTLIWTQQRAMHRARVDLLDLTDERQPVILDYKSTAASSPSEFMRSSYASFGYDIQAELYPQGLQELGYARPRFLFLVQESFEPYRCYWVENSESRSELASHKISRARRLWLECLKSNVWPGYPTSLVFQAEPAPWEERQEEEAQ